MILQIAKLEIHEQVDLAAMASASHQRLVNTTPNPRATKNRSGELWLLELLLLLLFPLLLPGLPLAELSVGDVADDSEVDESGRVEEGAGVMLANREEADVEIACLACISTALATTRDASRTASSMKGIFGGNKT